MKWTNGLKIHKSENNWTPGAGLFTPQGKIHEHYGNHNIKISSSPETAWPIKANFDTNHL